MVTALGGLNVALGVLNIVLFFAFANPISLVVGIVALAVGAYCLLRA